MWRSASTVIGGDGQSLSVAEQAGSLLARARSRSSELAPVQFERYSVLDTEEVVRQVDMRQK